MTLVWAHRGASKDAPENTLKAFRIAVEQGADGVELDVQLSADGHVVVCHDETLDRTTDGTGRIVERTLAELQRLDAGEGEVLPTLEQVLALLAPTRLECNIEMKNSIEPYPTMPQAVADVVAASGMTDRIWYSTFAHETVPDILAVTPTARVGLLLCRARAESVVTACRGTGAVAVHPDGRLLLGEGWLSTVREAGLRVHPWTIDKPADLALAHAVGVDAIITNVPAVARGIVDA